MNCAEWQERIALHAGGDPAEGVEGHLAECAECQAFRAEMRESLEALRSLQGEEIDAAHYTAVRARVMAELEHPRAALWWRLAWIMGLVLAVALGWPRREVRVPDPPRVMAAIPKAPLAYARRSDRPVAPARGAGNNRGSARQQAMVTDKRAPLTVKLQTSDPNIVIYWIAD